MLKKITHYLFKKPEVIGLENYLVLVFCFLAAILSILGTLINISLNLSYLTTASTLLAAVIFTAIYLYSLLKAKYVVSKYVIILISLIILDIQWFINYGSAGPILYLFVVLESFIVIFFRKRERIILTIIVFINVTGLFFVEYYYPGLIGKYSSDATRLSDLYWGMLIYLAMSIMLLNIALKFYISQQEKAELSDKLKTAFLANMSHEIRTPMNGILGFAELLKQPNLSGEEQQEFIEIIEKSGARMLTIINDIIDISKIEAGLMKLDIKEVKIDDITDFIYDFFKPETEKKGLVLTYKNSLLPEECIVKTDHAKIEAILINLVKNAIKFTHNGTIEFGVNRKNNRESPKLEFYVKDTGIGIPKERHDAIFERFIQADINDKYAYQGAGLGLSISKAFVEMLKGKIGVESEMGKGSIFYFTIPVYAENLVPQNNRVFAVN